MQPNGTLEQHIREILGHERFVLTDAPAGKPFLLRLLERVAEFLRPVLGWLEWLLQVSPLIYGLVLAFLCLLLVGLVAHIVYAVRMAMKAQKPGPYQPAQERRATPEELEEAVARLLDEGRYDEALRVLLAAALLRLDPEVGRRRRGLTNAAHVRRFARSAAAPHLARLVGHFDRCWYGRVPCTPEVLAEGMEDYRSIRDSCGRTGGLA